MGPRHAGPSGRAGGVRGPTAAACPSQRLSGACQQRSVQQSALLPFCVDLASICLVERAVLPWTPTLSHSMYRHYAVPVFAS